MFCGTTAGLPGRYFPRNRPNSRAEISVPPPAVVGMIILMDLPSNDTASAVPAGDAKQITVAAASTADRDRTVMTSPLRAIAQSLQQRKLLPNVQTLLAEDGRHIVGRFGRQACQRGHEFLHRGC